jgi:tetratricopeptide (TPR) repeat protein
MTQKIRHVSALAACLLLSAVLAPGLSGQKTEENDLLILQKYRMTRPELLKGQEQLKKDQLDKAEQTLLKVIKEMPENAEASFYLAETYYRKGEFGKGLAAIVEAEKQFPVIQKALVKRQAGTIAESGENRADIQNEILAEQQKTLEPITATTSRMQKEAASSQSRSQEDKAETYAIPAEYSYLHGNLLIRQKRFEEALAEYEKAIAAAPKHGKALNNIANIYYMGRQYDKALEYIQRAEAVGAPVNPDFKKAVLKALGR